MITFDSVTKRYPDGTVAVDALDLDVPDGKTMVLVGPSGYVAGFVGFDRGIRRLSLSAGPVLPADATAASALKTGEPWILVVGAGHDRRPRGWVSADRLADEARLGDVAAAGFGHAFTVGDDSLRAALDAAVLSPAGQASAWTPTGGCWGWRPSTSSGLRSRRRGQPMTPPERRHDVVVDSQ